MLLWLFSGSGSPLLPFQLLTLYLPFLPRDLLSFSTPIAAILFLIKKKEKRNPISCLPPLLFPQTVTLQWVRFVILSVENHHRLSEFPLILKLLTLFLIYYNSTRKCVPSWASKILKCAISIWTFQCPCKDKTF